MAASYNRVILLGNVTRDPELRYIPNGTAVTELGVAVNEHYKNANGEWVDEAVFVDVTLWARLAEVASEYLSKGSPVFIEGRLKLDSWQTPEGEKRTKLKVVGLRMQMLGGRGGGERGGGAASPRQDSEYSQAAPPPESFDAPPPGPMGGVDDDIPF